MRLRAETAAIVLVLGAALLSVGCKMRVANRTTSPDDDWKWTLFVDQMRAEGFEPDDIPGAPPEAYPVYAAVLRHLATYWSDEGIEAWQEMIVTRWVWVAPTDVIPDQDRPRFKQRLADHLEGVDEDLLDRFITDINEPWVLEDRFGSLTDLPPPIMLTDLSYGDVFNSDGSWAAWYQQGRGGVVGFSRIAFDETGSDAIVYISFGCGGLCGHGDVLLLAKRDGLWSVTDRAQLWVS